MQCSLVIIIDLLLINAQYFDERVVSYCGAKMCGLSNTHTFCQFQPGPSPECTGYIESELTTEERARIVARLNRRRSEAATGRLRKFPTAGNMLKLRWVEELAREAQRWADQCRPPNAPEENDVCRDLYSITVGQCVSSIVGEAPGLRVESLVDIWYMQAANYKGNVTSYILQSVHTGHYADFAQIIWSRTYMVGCGRSRFMTQIAGRWRNVERLVCNFAPRGPAPSRALWLPAAPASACPARSTPDPALIGLCNYRHDLDESDDVDNTMTPQQHTFLNVLFETENNLSTNYLGSLDHLYLSRIALESKSNLLTTTKDYEVHVKIKNGFKVDGSGNNYNETLEVYEEKNANITSKEITAELSKYKIKLVGRPKPYKLEDLNDVTPTQEKENNIKIENELLDVLHNQKELYADYEISDTPEANITFNWMELTTYHYNVNTASEIFGKEGFLLNTTMNNASKVFVTESTVNGIKDDNTTNDNSFNITVTEKPIEDYLSDPETIRELEEALYRVENNLAKTTMTKNLPVKVRRELRDLREEHTEAETTTNVSNDDSTPENVNEHEPKIENVAQEDVNNKTLDEAPMLNMVLRYMPYLKPAYESSMLGSVTNKAVHTLLSPSVLLIFVLRL